MTAHLRSPEMMRPRVAMVIGAKVANDLYRLKPTLRSWVPHIMVFVVPRQILELGDPSRRSCDACESFGARMKKIIKERTCRRIIKSTKIVENGKGDCNVWYTSYLKSYIQQSFTRLCVSERLSHGPENEKHLQRADYERSTTGKNKARWRKWQMADGNGESSPIKPRNMRECMEAVLNTNAAGTGV